MKQITIKKDNIDQIKDVKIDIVVDGNVITSIFNEENVSFSLTKESHIIKLKVDTLDFKYPIYNFMHVPYGNDKYSFVITIYDGKLTLL